MTLEAAAPTNEDLEITSMESDNGESTDTEQDVPELSSKTASELAIDGCDDLRKAIKASGKALEDLAAKREQLTELSNQLRDVLAPDYDGDVDPYTIALDRKTCEKSIDRLEAKTDTGELKARIKDTISLLKAYAETI